MANISAIEAVEISEIEHNLEELSSANLHIAKTLFSSNGFVAWRCLWSRDKGNVECKTLSVLGSLSTENNVTYVKARSILPREIVYNKFLTTFLEAHIPTAKLLQIYARPASTTGTILLQSPDAIAPILVQIIISHDEDPLSMKIACGGRCMLLRGNGLAIVRDRATDITIHAENSDYTVVTLDYALPEEN